MSDTPFLSDEHRDLARRIHSDLFEARLAAAALIGYRDNLRTFGAWVAKELAELDGEWPVSESEDVRRVLVSAGKRLRELGL